MGGGGPRFWFSAAPEQSQRNYAQVLIEVFDKHDTNHLVDELQQELSATIPGVRLDVRRLEIGPPVGIPCPFACLARTFPRCATWPRKWPRSSARSRSRSACATTGDPRDSPCGSRTDSDKANLSGLTNLDVAASSAAAMARHSVGVLRDGEDRIPVVARLRMEERSQLSDVRNLYVYSSQGLYIGVAGCAGLIFDVRGVLYGLGPQGRALADAPHAGIGFVEAHGLAVILAVLLWRARPERAALLTAFAVEPFSERRTSRSGSRSSR